MAALSPLSLPFLGAGLGYRRAIRAFYDAERHQLGFIEVMPEHLLETPARRSEALADCGQTPIVTHSVSLSIGTATGPDRSYLPKLARVNQAVGAAWTSDHCCFTKIGARNIGQLTPIPYTDDSLATVCRNVREVQTAVQMPFLVENISQYFQFPGNTMDEPTFLTELARRTGCGMLLDVTNLRNNVHNLGTDAQAYLDDYPLNRLVQLHLAGSEWVDGFLLDTHGAPIHRETWALTQQVLDASHVRALLIERDQTFGPMPRLRSEVRRAKKMMEAAASA